MVARRAHAPAPDAYAEARVDRFLAGAAVFFAAVPADFFADAPPPDPDPAAAAADFEPDRPFADPPDDDAFFAVLALFLPPVCLGEAAGVRAVEPVDFFAEPAVFRAAGSAFFARFRAPIGVTSAPSA
ncbi:hypothetical protein, partial [Streptomyces sp. URMC 123]|uniref:hypothetical protein n=1 Tax=Streptomyces sp. URMC 123 TaxID=3423403 RepID=UPI003F1A7323